ASRGSLVLEHLDVCEPGRVVDPAAPGTPVAMDAMARPSDRDMDVLPADQTPSHPALPAADEWEGGALHPYHARRLGLRRDLPHQRRTSRRAHRLARLLQSTTTTSQPRPPSPDRALTRAQPETTSSGPPPRQRAPTRARGPRRA